MRSLTIFFIIVGSLFVTSAYAENNLRFEVTGLNDEMYANVNSRLTILQKDNEQKLNEQVIQHLYEQAQDEIRKAIQPYGYFKPHIRSKLLHDKKEWKASFNVEKGIPVKIGHIDFKMTGPGKVDHQLMEFVKDFPLKHDEIFHTPLYEKTKEQLFQLANNRGYIQASFTANKIMIDIKQNLVHIVMHFDTGERYYFGEITFDDNIYQRPFLRRFINIKNDNYFSSKKLLDLQQDLSHSFYFQQVLVTPDFSNIKNHRVPIHISFTAPKSQRYNIGVGYGTFSGPRLTAGISLRRLNDAGHHFDAQLKLSTVLSTIVTKYYIPGVYPLVDQWIFSATYQHFLPENGQSNSGTLSAGFATKIGKVQATSSLNYLTELYKVRNEVRRNSHLLYPSVNFNYVEADDLVNPKYGYSLNLSLHYANHLLLSTTDFLQGELKGKYIFSPTSFSRFILRGDLGYSIVDNLTDLPLSMRFFAGGFGSVRGYQDSQIGPGKYLQVGSIEYQNKIMENWFAAVFYDIGAAGNHFNEHFKNGAGVGLIYESMIGPIKFYVAHGDKLGFEFRIGPEF